MATSQVSYFEKAIEKQDRRRKAAQQPGTGLEGNQLASLCKIGEVLFGQQIAENQANDDDYATVAIGYLPNRDWLPCIIVACKSIKAPLRASILNEAKKYYELLGDERLIVLQDQTSISGMVDMNKLGKEQPEELKYGQDHLHSEMAIVQTVYYLLGVPKGMIPHCGLQIACIMKGVCPDCSGWLSRHNIPHTYARKTVATNGWTNPLTGSFFKGKVGNGATFTYNKYFWNGFQPLGFLDTEMSKKTPYPLKLA
jgi:hypothetical protein